MSSNLCKITWVETINGRLGLSVAVQLQEKFRGCELAGFGQHNVIVRGPKGKQN